MLHIGTYTFQIEDHGWLFYVHLYVYVYFMVPTVCYKLILCIIEECIDIIQDFHFRETS